MAGIAQEYRAFLRLGKRDLYPIAALVIIRRSLTCTGGLMNLYPGCRLFDQSNRGCGEIAAGEFGGDLIDHGFAGLFFSAAGARVDQGG